MFVVWRRFCIRFGFWRANRGVTPTSRTSWSSQIETYLQLPSSRWFVKDCPSSFWPCWHTVSDCVGSVGFHPLRPLLLSVAGSRHFSAPSNGSDSSESSQESESDDNIEDEPGIQQAVKRSPQKLQPIPRDSSIKLWNFWSESLVQRYRTKQFYRGGGSRLEAAFKRSWVTDISAAQSACFRKVLDIAIPQNSSCKLPSRRNSTSI